MIRLTIHGLELGDSVLNEVFNELSQSDYHTGWFAYAVSAMAHVSVGSVSALVGGLLYFLIMGEYPEKEILWVWVMVFWATYEILTQRKNRSHGWGNFVDWLYLAVWGAGPAIFSAYELEIGRPNLGLDPFLLLVLLSLGAVHLLVGVISRLLGRYKVLLC